VNSVPCLFCQIVTKQVPAHYVLENENCVAFLDTRPLFHGHCLIVPRIHCNDLLDLPAVAVGPFFSDVQRLAAAVERAMGAQGSFVATNVKVSQSVPHLHVHVVPRSKGDGMKGFFWPRTTYRDDEEMASTAARIRQEL
ncbi:MAG TPA: HIT family protein, partial [Terriglobales bacterium]|nr:HIT family protein [Terriglobales bacterium]